MPSPKRMRPCVALDRVVAVAGPREGEVRAAAPRHPHLCDVPGLRVAGDGQVLLADPGRAQRVDEQRVLDVRPSAVELPYLDHLACERRRARQEERLRRLAVARPEQLAGERLDLRGPRRVRVDAADDAQARIAVAAQARAQPGPRRAEPRQRRAGERRGAVDRGERRGRPHVRVGHARDVHQLTARVRSDPRQVAGREPCGGAGVGERHRLTGGRRHLRGRRPLVARPRHVNDSRHRERPGLVLDRQPAPGGAVPALPRERRPGLVADDLLDVEQDPQLVGRQRPVEAEVERRRRVRDRPEGSERPAAPGGVLGVVLPREVVERQRVIRRRRLRLPVVADPEGVELRRARLDDRHEVDLVVLVLPADEGQLPEDAVDDARAQPVSVGAVDLAGLPVGRHVEGEPSGPAQVGLAAAVEVGERGPAAAVPVLPCKHGLRELGLQLPGRCGSLERAEHGEVGERLVLRRAALDTAVLRRLPARKERGRVRHVRRLLEHSDGMRYPSGPRRFVPCP